MGQTLTEFIRDKLDGQDALRDEILAELRWRGMDRDHGLIFEDSIEELDTPIRRPQPGYRVQLRRDLKDKGRYLVTQVVGEHVTVAPMRLATDKRTWEVVPEGKLQAYPADDLMTVVTHTEKVFPGLVSAGSVGLETDAPSHIAIRGENLHTLRALGYSHHDAVNLIYIDPPYNTGSKDWIYNDKRVDANDGYRHSKWLAFMHRRLELAKELLKDTGVILVAIGDDEHHRLRMLMDDVFGEQNFISNITWQGSGKNDSRFTSGGVDYMLIYGKSVQALRESGVRWSEPKEGIDVLRRCAEDAWCTAEGDAARATATFRKLVRPHRAELEPAVYRYDQIDDRGRVFQADNLTSPNPRDNLRYTLQHPVTRREIPFPDKGWRYSRETMEGLIADGRVLFGPDETTRPRFKRLLDDMEARVPYETFTLSRMPASSHLADVLREKRFPYPKDHTVLMRWIRASSPPDAVIVDFFGGSGSTLEAVLRLNEEDGGTRHCIIATSNELGEKEEMALAKKGLAPGDEEWEAKGVFEYVLRPRIETIVTGTRPDGSTYDKALTAEHRVEFFHLDYMDDHGDLDTYIDYDMMSPLLWARAGAVGPIPERPEVGDSVVGERFAILFDTDQIKNLAAALHEKAALDTIFIVSPTAETYRQAAADLASRLDRPVETVHLERTYLDSRSWIPRDRRRRAS